MGTHKNSFYFFFQIYLIIWPCHMACEILVPPPGTEPTPSALDAWNLNH